MKLHVMLCAVAQWVLITGNPLDTCVMGNGRYLVEDNDVDMTELTGNWYSLYIMPKNVTGLLTCWTSTLEINPDGTINLQYSYYNQSTKQRLPTRATLKQVKNAVRHYHHDDTGFNGDYYILATDYENFILKGGCPKRWDGALKLIWIEFRSKNPSKAALETAEEAVQKQGLEMSDFADFCPDKSQYY